MKVILVHRWEGTSLSDWYLWIKKELEKKGFEVIIPQMPNTLKPEINAWVSELKRVVGKVDENMYLIGHSIGYQTILRFLERENHKVGKVIFVAGWFKLDNLESKEIEEIAKPWIDTPINFNRVKQKISKLTVFLSSNEPYGYVKYNAKIFKERLGANVIIEKNKGHFTESDNIKKVPEVLKEILT